ncbi:hypothetical protein [Streptomyces sp. CB03234]|uniref:hypothetical protein n=1 Tax=Streptomyces sp. (strain CB03234) TaxID=1703937 RepID=UPI001F51C317|nr:hypothetical protein [Streptomyces sp. CB03234]
MDRYERDCCGGPRIDAHQETAMSYPPAPRLHHSHQRPRRHRPGAVFATVNGSAFALHLLLACTAEDFMANPLWGEITTGLLGLLLQGSLLVGTAALYDRHADEPEV